MLIEFACSEDSLIGKRGPFKGVKVIRLTKQTCDLLTPHGLKKALEIVRDYPGCSIHASIPCFPWSSWVKMNLHRLGDKYAKKLAKARQQSLKMLHAFKIVAREVISLGGHVSFEWPRYCTGWKLQQLKSFISKFGLATVDFDGCAVGLKSRKGNYIKKPWRIVTTSDSLIQSLRVKRCSGQHSHQECGGSESARSAYYTDQLADHIIVGLCCQQRSQSIRDKNKKRDCSGPPAAAAIQTETSTLKNPERHQNSHCGNQKSHCGDASQSVLDTLSRQLDKAVNKATAKLAKLHQSASVTKTFVDDVKNHFIDDQQVEKQLLHRQVQQLCKEQHRQKIVPCPFNIMGLITKVLNKKDSEYHSQEAKDAILTEVNKLITAGVWDTQPVSRRDASRIHPDATFSRLFGILGIKDFEAASRKFKYRVVVQGSNMKDINNNDVFFSDTSNAPTNMACIRSIVAYSQLSGGESSQVDAEQAYIQLLLDDNIHIYITIPEEMWSDDMIKSAAGINNPVFRLRRPLYGWSRSGNIWEDHLDTQLKSIPHDGQNGNDNWKAVDDWPQTYWKIGALGKVVIMTVYVDDFILGGPGSSQEWPSIRKVVRTTEPTPVGRVLGVHHKFDKLSKTATETTFDMVGYVQQTLEMYNSLEGSHSWPLKENTQYPWYEPSQHEIDTIGQQPGIFGPNSASLLMKALYCARMVRLDICYTINTLSKYITKWSALCDKQIRHLYSYLLTSQEYKLHGVVDSIDLDTIEIRAYPDADLAGTFDSTKATSGGFVELAGLNTFFPLDWYSKRQTATAHSTSEAELLSASKMLREHAVPLQNLWKIMLGRPITTVINEDNESTITVIKSGYSPQLRYLAKHHRISLGLVHELCSHDDIVLQHIGTDKQKGDILTKGLQRPKHEPALQMVGIYPILILPGC